MGVVEWWSGGGVYYYSMCIRSRRRRISRRRRRWWCGVVRCGAVQCSHRAGQARATAAARTPGHLPMCPPRLLPSSSSASHAPQTRTRPRPRPRAPDAPNAPPPAARRRGSSASTCAATATATCEACILGVGGCRCTVCGMRAAGGVEQAVAGTGTNMGNVAIDRTGAPFGHGQRHTQLTRRPSRMAIVGPG